MSGNKKNNKYAAVAVWSLLLLIILVNTACSSPDDAVSTGKNNDNTGKEAISLSEIIAQNNGQQLLTEYAAVCAVIKYQADDYTENMLICHDAEAEQYIFAESGADYQRLIRHEQGYYLTRDGLQSQLVFLGQQYQTLYLQNKLPYVAFAPALTALLQEDKAVQDKVWAAAAGTWADEPVADSDQNKIAENTAEQKDANAAAAQYTVSCSEENDYYSLELSKTTASGKSLIDHYHIAKDGLLIQEVTVSERSAEGSITEISSKVMQYAQQYEFTMPDYATAMQKATPRRTVTFITDPGTAAEKEYVVDAPARAFVSPYYADSYGLYADAAGSKPFVSQSADADGNMPDATIYLIKK